MVDKTPKKIVNESLKCFTCSSLCSADERIFIFGKSSHNFAKVIKSALNIDVDCYVYDTNSNLFVCKTLCYKRLLKFQRATEKVEEIKKEIQDAFQARPRAKRLAHPSDRNDDEISDAQRSLATNVKASRTLSLSNQISTTYASSFGSQPLLAGVNPLSRVLSPIRLFQTTQDFLPPLTSTPLHCCRWTSKKVNKLGFPCSIPALVKH